MGGAKRIVCPQRPPLPRSKPSSRALSTTCAHSAVAGARVYAFKVVETPGRFKETANGVWTAQEIAESWDGIVKA